MSRRSRDKGKRAERHLAAELRKYGIEARRGQQYSGSPDSPDVICDLPGWHLECKWNEQFEVGAALLDRAWIQACDECGYGKRPLVVWKRSRRPWMVTWSTAPPENKHDFHCLVTTPLDDFLSALGYQKQP